MVDIFGSTRRRGKRGPPGSKGETGDGLSAFFFSKQLAQWFYESLTFSCYFKKKRSGLIFDKVDVIGIKNQVGDNHAVSINKFEQLVRIPDFGYGVLFTKSLYKIDNIDWALGDNSKAIFTFAFKVTAWPKTLGYIFHTESGDRSIYLKGAHLIIQTCKSPEHHVLVEYSEDEWNICYIEFNNYEGALSHYRINDRKGTFITIPSTDQARTIFIGGKEIFF